MSVFLGREYDRWSELCAFVPPRATPGPENDAALVAHVSALAEREARRILAETEPRGGRGPQDPLCWYEVRLWQYGGSSREILAESLARFCALEQLQ